MAAAAAHEMGDEAVLREIIGSARVAEPTGAEHRVTVVLLCGFMEADPSRLVRWFQRLVEHEVSLETVRLVGLAAPKRSITCYDGWQTPGWFDYITETYDTEDVIDETHFAQSRRLLTQIVDAEVARLGGNPDRLVLLGFSQGGNMAYDVALSYPAQLGGLIARRTSLRNESQLGTNRTLPITHFHGEEDDGIGCNRAQAGIARLHAAGFTHVALHTQPGLNHVDYSTKEMEVYAAFLTSLFPHLSTAEAPAANYRRRVAPASDHLGVSHAAGPAAGPDFNAATKRSKTGQYRWLVGFAGLRRLLVALWRLLLAFVRHLKWNRRTRVADSDASGTMSGSPVPFVVSNVDAQGFQLPLTAADNRSKLLTMPVVDDGGTTSRELTVEGISWTKAAAADMAVRNARSAPSFALPTRGTATTKTLSEGMDGNYTDPNHPNGYRMLKLSADGASAIIVGNDDAKSGVTFTLHARVRGTSIEIDFTPKARRVGKLVGVWDGSGIVFADGNRWKKVPGLNEAFVLF